VETEALGVVYAQHGEWFPPQDMAFNNLPCTLVGMTAMGLQDSPLAEVTMQYIRAY
jgi:hypothetical protein